MSYEVPPWISAFRDQVVELDKQLTEIAKHGLSVEDACGILVELNRLKFDFGIIYDTFSGIVSEVMANENEVVLADGAKVEKRYSNKRTGWQHRDLASEVARRIIDMSVDMDTGEVTMSQQDMITDVLTYVQPSYWRVKELQNIGINADNYCEVGEGKTSIVVQKGQNK